MKKITLLLLGMLMITSASAVEYKYSPLLKDGKKWVYFYSDTPEYFYVGYLINTTEMNGHSYINYYTQYDVSNPDEINLENAMLKAFFREEDKKVYCVYNDWVEIEGQIYYSQYQFAKYFDESTGENEIFDFNDVTDPYVNYTYGYQPLFEGSEVEVTQVQIGDYLSNFYSIGDDIVIAERCGVANDSKANSDRMLDPFEHRYQNGDLRFPKLAYIEEDGVIIYKGENYALAMEYLNPDAITTINCDKQVAGIRYNNIAGVESSEPFKGMNIKVTTYTDGSRTTEKILR
ncbi:MAG: hypothetical protein J5629_02390 [Muribaculaceae bacterium]|nr:hypothetical protein [Muribaculaceae bacterium]